MGPKKGKKKIVQNMAANFQQKLGVKPTNNEDNDESTTLNTSMQSSDPN